MDIRLPVDTNPTFLGKLWLVLAKKDGVMNARTRIQKDVGRIMKCEICNLNMRYITSLYVSLGLTEDLYQCDNCKRVDKKTIDDR